MRVDLTNQYTKNYTKHSTYNKQKYVANSISNNIEIQNSYPQVYFLGKINPKKIGTVVDAKKLLKQLNEILKENLPFDAEAAEEEFRLKAMRHIDNVMKRMESHLLDCMILRNASETGSIDKRAVLVQAENLLKKIKITQQSNDNFYYELPPEKDIRTDYDLIEKLKTALTDDKFNFLDIFKRHYGKLNEIKTIKELNEAYPSIQTPARPEQIVADKLESTITRDFYENLYETLKNKDKKSFSDMMSAKIIEVFDNNIKVKNEEEVEFYVTKLSEYLIQSIQNRLTKAIDTASFTSIPEQRKIKKGFITDDDIRFLNMDYDDFVTSVIREQYLNFKNPNEIIYTSNGKKIKVSSIRDLAYKFEKIPNRIKNIISSGENIKTAQRSYDSYSPEFFRKRLEFYGDRMADSEELLEEIVEFNACKFEKEDILMLKKFLNGLDEVWDEKIMLKEFLNRVRQNNIKPLGTEKLNNIEHQKAIEALQNEQKKLAALKNEQQKFEDFITILHKNKMNYIAELCSQYKPESLDAQELYKANLLLKSFKENLDKNGNIKDLNRLRISLFRKVTYLDNKNEDSKLIHEAEKFAKNKKGEIDIEKAGQYIINHDILEKYPQSLEYAKNKEISESIIKYFKNDRDSAIRYLCKYDDYEDLPISQKSKLSEVLKIFNIKETLDKNIIKKIIENDYILSDTSAKAVMSNNTGKTVIATISSKAKKELYDYYKFPKCVEYFTAFENALSQFAQNKNSAGIKLLGRNNNSMKNVIELKILGYSDRLLSFDGTYYFDTFSNTGFH